MPNITTFDTSAPYIFLSLFVLTSDNQKHKFDAILDTGAPITEFSDKALYYTGFIENIEGKEIKNSLQTQKYSKITLPQVHICGHYIDNLKVFVSQFEESWGIDALVGLDFFRKFKTEIDYSAGHIISDDYKNHDVSLE
jgi:hypothetical protein